ncbi:hypothetical protein PF003_g4867 [Phytophthora fragariae]|nr:hypothetical protein PF003_g4867 [Phytophthora fragariae]
MDSAAKWWVDMSRRPTDRKQKGNYLKKVLLRRYSEKLDKSAAEWRVAMRMMIPKVRHTQTL